MMDLTLIQIVQYIGFILSQASNCLLTFLIIKRASSRYGSYKSLMIAYSVYSMIYSCIEILAQPVIHTKGSAFILYIDSWLKYQKQITNILAIVYCASFSFCISLLSMQFLYRYFAVCKPLYLQHFDGSYIFRLLIPPTVLSIIWYFSCYLFFSPTEAKAEYMRLAIKEVYNEDIDHLGYIEVVYFFEDQNGKKVISIFDWIGCIGICVGIMNICIWAILICGFKIYQKMSMIDIHSMSKRTRDLNKQLFRTLIVQTLVPVCIMFIPVGLLLVLPVFSIDMGSWANAPSMYAGLYPALDAMIVILMIQDFRNFVFCRKRREVMNVTTMGSSSIVH